MTSAQSFLKKYLANFDFIEGIVLSDKEGIEVFSVYRSEDNIIKENQAATMFVAALVQSNENFAKLNQNKVKNLTLFYDNYIVYVEGWGNLNLSLFNKNDSNIGMIYEIAADMKTAFAELIADMEKLK